MIIFLKGYLEHMHKKDNEVIACHFAVQPYIPIISSG